MGARSGNNYLSSLRKLKAEVWIGATRIADPTIHPLLVTRARAIATLYDLQIEHPAAMTYRLADGDRPGRAFMQPQSSAEVQSRGAMFRRWAESHGGRLSATPDGLNAGLAALASAADFLPATARHFAANLRDYYNQARRHDWCAAHTTLAAAAPPLEVAARGDDGIVVSGTRAVSALAPLAEELVVLPTAAPAADSAGALAFALNCNARGLQLRCAEAATPAATGALYELACVAVFDKVLIPWARVFLSGGRARDSAILAATGLTLNLRHQQVVRGVVAAEFRLGQVANLAARGAAYGVPRISARLVALAAATQLARALLHAAEIGAQPDQWGQWQPAAAPLAAAHQLLAQFGIALTA